MTFEVDRVCPEVIPEAAHGGCLGEVGVSVEHGPALAIATGLKGNGTELRFYA
jgi:hypothetical protein